MKKQKQISLPRVNANALAKTLKKSMGEVKAFKVADSIVRNTEQIGSGDFNNEIFSMKEIGKNVRFWTQVRNLLK